MIQTGWQLICGSTEVLCGRGLGQQFIRHVSVFKIECDDLIENWIYCPVDCYYCLNFASAGKFMQNCYFKNGNPRIFMQTKFTADHMSGYS